MTAGSKDHAPTQRMQGWLIRLYPRAWRDRYGDEFLALLDECLDTPLDVLDIFLGALDAHLQFPSEMNWRFMNMTNKLRTSILMVFAAYIAFIIGGLSLQGLVDDSPVAPLMRTNLPLLASWTLVEAGAVIALLAVGFGGLPLALSVIRRAVTSSRRDLALLLVPGWALLALLLYGAFLASVAKGWISLPGVIRNISPGNFPLGNRLVIGGFILTFILGTAASTAAVWKVVSASDSPEQSFQLLGQRLSVNLYRHAYLPSVIATLSMLLMLIATLVFGWLAASSLPAWFHGSDGLLLMNTALSFAITLFIMASSTALASIAILRAYPSWRLT